MPQENEPLARFVRDARRAKGYNQDDIRRRGGPSKGWIGALEAGTMPDRPKPDTLRRLADALDVDPVVILKLAGYPAYIISSVGAEGVGVSSSERMAGEQDIYRLGEGMPRRQGNVTRHMVPLFGPVAAGEPLMWTDDALVRMIQGEVGDDAAFVIRGNSVSDYDVWDGDTVFATWIAGRAPVSGDMVVVESEGSYCCKIYRENKLGRYLESHEKGKEPEPFLLNGDVKLIAIVTGSRLKFRRRG